MSEIKSAQPVDLAAIRGAHARETAHRPDRLGLDGSCVCRCQACGNARVWLTGQVPAMADEIEALRKKVDDLEGRIQDMVYTNMGDDL